MTKPAEAGGTFGEYRILDQLGTGGMSTVHLAEHRSKDGSFKMVALKRLLPRAATRKELRESFLDEARLLRYLHQPNIPETYDSGKIGDTHYIAMEFVPGPTLKELIEHCGKTVGTIPTEITLNVVAQICDALDHAHNRCDEKGKPLGIIHRDISPANIILSETGLVKLIDFGLAKAAISSAATDEGVIKGKFNYVAPEYIGGTLDARADIWALGVVVYELLTSRRLFDAPDDLETMNRVRKLPIPSPSRANPRVTPELDYIVMTALQRDPSRRWQSAAHMRDALRRVIEKPGNNVDNRHVIDWVNWVFSQKPGTEASGVSKLISMTKPMRAVEAPDPEDISLRPRGWLRNLLSPRSRR
ncbi:MAG TPA: serine/threonine-protein kinase [Kofleriaceae bacterium]|nr:serine/threonine-protein kinase [Kofleriaceae bacterium]